MRAYYLQAEYEPGKHRVVATIFDSDLSRFDEGVLAPFRFVTVNETDKQLCFDLTSSVNKMDVNGCPRHFVDASGTIQETPEWKENEMMEV